MLRSMMSIFTREPSLGLATGPWHPAWLDSPQMIFCLVVLLLGIPLLLWLSLALSKLSYIAVREGCARRVQAHLTRLRRDQRGTATIEFTLVFPILLFLIMLLTQSTLLMGARLVVNYAAFAAARSAVVVIPLQTPSEPYNTVLAYGSQKAELIREAAIMAVLPVAGKLTTSTNPQLNPEQLVDGLTRYYQAYGMTPPFWIERFMPDRLRYAEANTRTTILQTRVVNETLELEPLTQAYTFGPRDPITVQVTHRMNLAVPYVGQIFADGRNDSSQGGGLYTNITSRCTLTNEGIVPELPPKPELDRIP